MLRDLLAIAMDAASPLAEIVAEDCSGLNHRLKALIREKSFRKGEFTLASGKQSKYYFDLKPTMLDPLGSNLLGNAILDRIAIMYDMGEIGLVDAIGGMATGGIPLVTVAMAMAYQRQWILPAIFIRKATKDHGTERRIEGVLEPGQTVLLIEDVTASGESIMEAVRAVRDAGCLVQNVITVIDRNEGAAENLMNEGIKLEAIFCRDEFDNENDQDEIDDEVEALGAQKVPRPKPEETP